MRWKNILATNDTNLSEPEGTRSTLETYQIRGSHVNMGLGCEIIPDAPPHWGKNLEFHLWRYRGFCSLLVRATAVVLRIYVLTIV